MVSVLSLFALARDKFLMREAEGRVLRNPIEDDARTKALRERAELFAEAADSLPGPLNTLPALALLREANGAFCEVAVGRRGRASGGSFLANFRALKELVGAPPLFAQETVELVGEGSVAVWEALSFADQVKLRAQAEDLKKWLRAQAVSPSRTSIKKTRVRRVVILLALCLVAVGFLGRALFRSPNVALNKPVQLSGTFPQSTAPPDGSGAVNGIIEMTYGVHTNTNTHAWVQVDLLREHRLDKVVVHNRGEPRYQDEGLPLELSVSSDGQSYRQVARRTEHFTDFEPWVAETAGVVARFVRIRNEREAYVALTEIEVFGKPDR